MSEKDHDHIEQDHPQDHEQEYAKKKGPVEKFWETQDFVECLLPHVDDYSILCLAQVKPSPSP